MTTKCEATAKVNKFCAIRAVPKCDDCTQLGSFKNHREACKKETADWGKAYAYRALHDGEVRWYSYEAHHVLCVSAVASEIFGHAKMQPILRKTDWCINKPENMLAMPLWGHTIKWYCTIRKSGSYKFEDMDAPPFANIPQHNIGHNGGNSYRTEIEIECAKLRTDATQKGHELTGETLAKRLDQLSGRWREKLIDVRGKRRGGGARADGTHAAWRAASNSVSKGKTPADDWFLPFSMAKNTKVNEVPPPTYDFDEKFSTWVDKLAKAMMGK
jgi:hypothetical protein